MLSSESEKLSLWRPKEYKKIATEISSGVQILYPKNIGGWVIEWMVNVQITISQPACLNHC
jgi:hypothetical protein